VFAMDVTAILGTGTASQAASATGGRKFIAEQRLICIGEWVHVPTLYKQKHWLGTGRETCRWMSAAAAASGDRVLRSIV